MARYYRVSPTIWTEPWDDDQRMLAFYLLTGPHRTTEGLFRLPTPYIAADMGWTPRRIETNIAKLIEAGFVMREGDITLIVKALKNQPLANDNQVKAVLTALETVPSSPLDAEFARLAQRFAQRLSKPLAERFPERFPEPLPEPFAHTPTPTPTPPPALAPSPTPEGDEANASTKSKTIGEVAARMSIVCKQPNTPEALRVVDLLAEYVDLDLIDECIGWAAKRDENHAPRRPVYFLEAVREWAAKRNVTVPELRLSRASA